LGTNEVGLLDHLRVFEQMVTRAEAEGTSWLDTATDRQQEAVDGVFNQVPRLIELVEAEENRVIAVVRLEDGRYAIQNCRDLSGLTRADLEAIITVFKLWGAIQWDRTA
jgi:hypothetical protein